MVLHHHSTLADPLALMVLATPALNVQVLQPHVPQAQAISLQVQPADPLREFVMLLKHAQEVHIHVLQIVLYHQ